MKMKRWVAIMLVLVSIVSILPTFWGMEIEAEAALTSGIKIGDKITLGKYLGEPIVWVCVDIDENGPLMLAEDVLCFKEFDAAGENSTYHSDGWGYIRKRYGSNCWQDSNIRQWLNSDETSVSWTHCAPSYKAEPGFMTNFTSSEKSIIKTVNHIVNVNQWESTRSGYCDGGTTDSIASSLTSTTFNPKHYYYKYVQDKIFLISAHQYNTIYQTNRNYLNADRDYYTCIADGSGGACYEWVSYVSANSTNLIHNFSASNIRGIRPAFYLDVEKYQESLLIQRVGILKDYVISVNLDEAGINWISEITVENTKYPVAQGVLNLSQAEQLKYKKIFFSLSKGTVDFVCDLDKISTLNLGIGNELVLSYKNGRFPDKKIELSGMVNNLVAASVDPDLAQSLGSLSLTNITVELLSDNTDVIYFKEHWYSTKKQHIKFSIDGSVPLGGAKAFSKNIYVNTGYSFPKDKESDSMKVTCVVTAQKNGKTLTDIREINVKLINGDFGYKQSIKPTWKTQTIDELLNQMLEESQNCSELTIGEKVEVAMVIEAIRKSDHLLDIRDDYESFEFVYDMACYFYGLECPTVGTAAAAFLEAIIGECETASDELEGQLRVALQSITKSGAFNKFIYLYKENYDTVLGNKKKGVVKCPVDVLVTDEDGNTVLSIVNDEVAYEAEGAVGFVCEGKKILFLPTDIDHQIQITATDNGTMDYSVTEYSSTGEARTVSYSDIVLTKDKVCAGDVIRDTMPDESVYQLTEMTLDRPAFSGASLTLQDNITISFKASEDQLIGAGYTSPYVLFEMNGEKSVVSDYRVVDGKYLFDFNDISPDNMNDTIKATLCATYDDVVYQSETREYSVAAYCYNILNKYYSDEYAKLRTLLVDLLNYGAASQVYMNYKTDELVNSQLTEAQKVWGTRTQRVLETVQNLEYMTIENPTVQWKGGGLNLQESVGMRFKISTDSMETLIVKVTNDAGDETIISSDTFEATNGGYYVFYEGLNADQMSDVVYLTVYDGDVAVSNTVRYSIESYAYSKQNSDDANLAELVKAMMKYGDSAYSYVN